MRYLTVAVVAAKNLREVNCFTFEEMEELVSAVALEAMTSLVPTEVFVLMHNHAPIPDDDVCACSTYLRHAGPYVTFNVKEALEKD